MDGQTVIERDAFYRMLLRTMPRPGAAPFAMLPWPPRVHLAIFVHRVTGLAPGLYLLARDPAQTDALRAALKPEFAWETTPGCPPELPLYRLASGDTRGIASRISCGQDIAADGCFSLGMLAEFERPLTEHGAWVYPRLFWECGMIGQVLYLEAEAAGLRGTGIGCFFDDGMHSLLGLTDRRFPEPVPLHRGRAIGGRAADDAAGVYVRLDASQTRLALAQSTWHDRLPGGELRQITVAVGQLIRSDGVQQPCGPAQQFAHRQLLRHNDAGVLSAFPPVLIEERREIFAVMGEDRPAMVHGISQLLSIREFHVADFVSRDRVEAKLAQQSGELGCYVGIAIEDYEDRFGHVRSRALRFSARYCSISPT